MSILLVTSHYSRLSVILPIEPAFTEIHRGRSDERRRHWHEQAAIRAAAMHRRVFAYEAVIKEILETEDHFLEQLNTVEEVGHAEWNLAA